MKKLIILPLLLFCSTAFAAIAIDTSTSFTGAAASSETKSFTIGGGANFLIVTMTPWECTGATPSVVTGATSVVWNTTENLTKAIGASVDTGGNCSVNTEVWYLHNPTTGTHNVVATYPVSMGGIYGAISSWSGVKTSGQPDATSSSTADWTADPTNKTITTVADNSLVIDAWATGTGSSTGPSGGQTRLGTDNSSYKVAGTAGSQTMGWQFTGSSKASEVISSFSPTLSSNTSGGFFGE